MNILFAILITFFAGMGAGCSCSNDYCWLSG